MSYPTKASFTFNHADQATYPSTTPAEQKTNFDKRSEEMRVALNAVTAILNAVTDGASGADSLGMTAIPALGASATVQSIVEALVTRLQATTDSASGADLIGATAISGLTGATAQALLEALSSALTTHKTSTDHDGRYYTETEVDNLLSPKAPLASPAFTGAPTVATGTDYTTAKLRNVILSTADPTAGDGNNGDVWIKYIA